jgi:hypothetical protein
MAKPTFNLVGDTFTFSNEHITIAAQADIVPPPNPSITVESVAITTPHDTVTLPVHDLVVPTHVVEHIFDLLP